MSESNEASVEEILDSIKKVIARDNRSGAMTQRREREVTGISDKDADEPAEEVLDLAEAELIEESGTSESLADNADDPLDDEEEMSLITTSVRSSMQENFAALSMLSEPGAKPQIVRSGETSLEGLVREMLRPMLSEWLDQNLPGMVERMVKAEISRIARKRG